MGALVKQAISFICAQLWRECENCSILAILLIHVAQDLCVFVVDCAQIYRVLAINVSEIQIYRCVSVFIGSLPTICLLRCCLLSTFDPASNLLIREYRFANVCVCV